MSLAIDRPAINQSQYLGLARWSSSIVPESQEYFWAPPPMTYDPKRAKQLLAEAGYPNGFDAGEVIGDTIYGAAMGEPVVNFLQTVGIRARLRPMERAAFTAGFGERKLRGLIVATSGAAGNAATRLESFAVSGARYAYGSLPGHRRALRRAGQRAESARAQAAPRPRPAAHLRAHGLHPRAGLGVHQRGGQPARRCTAWAS